MSLSLSREVHTLPSSCGPTTAMLPCQTNRRHDKGFEILDTTDSEEGWSLRKSSCILLHIIQL